MGIPGRGSKLGAEILVSLVEGDGVVNSGRLGIKPMAPAADGMRDEMRR